MTFDEWYYKEGLSSQRLERTLMERAWNAAKATQPEEVTPMSLRAFGSPDALASYCINKAAKRQCTEWLIAYEILYGATPPQKDAS